MLATQETFKDLIARAVDDPDFAGRLVQDPVGAAAAQGIELPGEVAETLKGVSSGGHEQVVESLNARMSRMIGYLH